MERRISRECLCSAFELPAFSALASLVFQNQVLQVFSVFVLRTQPLHFGRKIFLYRLGSFFGLPVLPRPRRSTATPSAR
ncbi:hypothetical protein CLOSTMETH_03173 [[Clostridium] methylpentosum DSM 5476]|uniref:Uncharacterized protein n=1 Tax=[Clostridium] methylpentosum DSM 5476 TaxID=537013 RepID=C0EHD6_9FIRM|nr:hypothetical protein CLOSTMETH_03173 [[Clostridium] methylpentosum DSM 5476]